MKTFICSFLRITLILSLISAVPLVEGKKEIDNKISDTVFKGAAYHLADTIKKNINFVLSTILVYNQTAEVENLMIFGKCELKSVIDTATSIYNQMDLERLGLSKKAFEYAWMGHYKLQKEGLLHKTSVLSICDFSQSSSCERLYVIDVCKRKLLYRTFVAHGVNSGEEYANSFSNKYESYKSSLGFYVTCKTFYGSNGLSLRINGVDKGFNDHASKRNIVIHGAAYVSLRILQKYGVMGTTCGCPAIPPEMISLIIPVVKNGSCFFIYYPSKKYLAQSRVLNG